jgi:hypothetical protein
LGKYDAVDEIVQWKHADWAGYAGIREVKVLAVLDYMFHGSCRKGLSLALEPISKSAVHYLAKKVSSVKVSMEPRYRRCI